MKSKPNEDSRQHKHWSWLRVHNMCFWTLGSMRESTVSQTVLNWEADSFPASWVLVYEKHVLPIRLTIKPVTVKVNWAKNVILFKSSLLLWIETQSRFSTVCALCFRMSHFSCCSVKTICREVGVVLKTAALRFLGGNVGGSVYLPFQSTGWVEIGAWKLVSLHMILNVSQEAAPHLTELPACLVVIPCCYIAQTLNKPNTISQKTFKPMVKLTQQTRWLSWGWARDHLLNPDISWKFCWTVSWGTNQKCWGTDAVCSCMLV